MDELCGLSLDALSHKDLLAVAERIEALTRRKTMLERRIVARLDAECAPRDLGAKSLPDLLARRLRISRKEAGARIADARVLAPRTAMSGERLAPRLPAVAEGVAAGVIGVEQARIIRKFADRLPARVAAEQCDAAQAGLAAVAAEFPPEDVHALLALSLGASSPGGA